MRRNYLTPQVSQQPVLVSLRADGGAWQAGERGSNLGHHSGVLAGGHVCLCVLVDGDVRARLEKRVRALGVEEGRPALLSVVEGCLDETEWPGFGG